MLLEHALRISPVPEVRFEETPRVRRFTRRYFLRRASDDNLSSTVSALRPEIDHEVGCLDDIEVMFDQEHRMPGIDQTIQGL